MATRKQKGWTYRVEGIPWDTSAEELIRQYFEPEDQEYLHVRSLFPNVDCPEEEEYHDGGLTATVYYKPQEHQPEGPRIQHDLIQVDKSFTGFTPLYVPPSGTPIAADIIAVTGLAGHAYGSWAHHEDRMWLRDYLKPTASNARILTYGYESGLKDSQSFGILQDHTNTFFRKLIDIREEGKCENRPIIFIGHSLGCLIIKKAMIDAGSIGINASRLPVRAIVFLAAPHKGLHVEALQTLVKGQPSYHLVHELEKGSATLLELNTKFAQMAHEIDILTCYETKQTKQAVELEDGSWARKGSPVIMVDRDSAIVFTAREIHVGADADHSEIAKLKRTQAGIFSHVKSAIHRALRPTVSLAETYQDQWASPNNDTQAVSPPAYTLGNGIELRSSGILSSPSITSPTPSAEALSPITRRTTFTSISRNPSDYDRVADTLDSPRDAGIGNQTLTSRGVSEVHQELEPEKEPESGSGLGLGLGPKSALELESEPGLFMDEPVQQSIPEPEPELEVEPNQEPTPELHQEQFTEKTNLLSDLGPEAGDTITDSTESDRWTACILCSSLIQNSDPHYLYHPPSSATPADDKDENAQSTGKDNNGRNDTDDKKESDDNDDHDKEHSPCNDKAPTWCCLGCAISLDGAPFVCPEHQVEMKPMAILIGSNHKRYVPYVSKRVTDLDSKVVTAIKENNPGAIQTALDQNPRLLGPYSSAKDSPLHLAAKLGHPSCTNVLLEVGADANARDNDNNTPLTTAIIYEQLDVVIALLKGNADVNAPHKRGSALALAVTFGLEHIVEVLLAHNAKTDLDGPKLLCTAADYGNINIVELLLARDGVEVNAVDEEFGNTPLHYASAKGHEKVVKAFLDHNATVDVVNKESQSPLHKVCYGLNDGQVRIARMLLTAGADVCRADSDKKTPLHLAVATSNVELCNALISHGADLNARGERGRTPLHVAVLHDQCAVLGCLLAAGADYEVGNVDDNTPLYGAAGLNRLDICRILLSYKAKLDARNADGWTPLHTAVYHNHLDTVKLLLNNDPAPDINAATNVGNTGLHIAVLKDFVDVCTALLDRNAFVHAKNNEGRTALLIAIWNKRPEIIRLLLERGAYRAYFDDNASLNCNHVPLLMAAAKGHIRSLDLVCKHADLELVVTGHNAVSTAAFNGHLDAVKFLLMKGASGSPPPSLRGKWKYLEFTARVDKATQTQILEILRAAKHK